MALLEGRVLNVRNCAKEIGLTNIGREIPRMIEDPFGVIVSRTPKVGKNRYGQESHYMDYRLNKTEFNQPGIAKMKEYVNEQLPKGKKVSPEPIPLKQTALF